ncbi:MAG: hypothetical protein LBD19_01700 [Endomicrobium sp.]|jgi:hypothetical protein|nr:hypothetical protein [Endomicrobium sp.]
MSDNKVEEQFNVRLSQKLLDEITEARRQFGGNISQSSYGRMALIYFTNTLKSKGALAMLAEIIDDEQNNEN